MADDHRLPAHDLEAQRACLGTFLDASPDLAYDPIKVLSGIVLPLHFFGDEDQWIYEAALRLRAAGEPVNGVMVGIDLQARGRLTPPIEDRIRDCIGGQIHTKREHVEGFARRVLDMHARRTALEVLQRADADLRSTTGPATAQIAAIVADLAVVATGSEPRPRAPKALSFADRVTSALAVMRRRATGDEWATPTPWESVNNAMRGGFWPGLYTLSSASGMGKTQWAIECALHAAEIYTDAASHESKRRGEEVLPDRVAYIALELGDVDLVARFLGLMAANVPDRLRATGQREDEIRDIMTANGLAGIRWSDLFFGVDGATGLRSDTRERVLDNVERLFAARLAALPIHVETADAIGWSYRNLVDLVNEQKPRLVVLDYSQLVAAPEGSREELRQTIGNVAKVARDLARRPGGPAILALSSTARANYGAVDGTGASTESKAPKLGQGDPARLIGLGKESGELEFTADAVLALARESIPDDLSHEEKIAAAAARPTWLAVAKGRGFPAKWVEMHFDGSRFTEPDEARRPPRPSPASTSPSAAAKQPRMTKAR